MLCKNTTTRKVYLCTKNAAGVAQKEQEAVSQCTSFELCFHLSGSRNLPLPPPHAARATRRLSRNNYEMWRWRCYLSCSAQMPPEKLFDMKLRGARERLQKEPEEQRQDKEL